MAEGYEYKLTEGQLTAFKDAFALFDKQQQGYIPYSDFGALFRSVGQNPTDAEVMEIVTESDTAGTQHFDLDKFLRICEGPRFKDPMKEELLLEAFRTFDKDGKGLLTVAQLRYMLQCLGERLPDDEADEFVEFADKEKTGEINYENLVKDLMERDPGQMAAL